jgi:MFS family permease
MVTDRGSVAGLPSRRPDHRHNLLALGADLALFHMGFAMVSPATILPAFATHLGAPNVVIGAIPAVMTVGWLLPALFAAGHAETLTRKLPFVMRYSVWERVPFVVLTVLAFVTAERMPALTLGLLLVMLLVITGSGGFLLPAWMDIVGRAVPITLRGRFFAVANVMGHLGGLGAGVGTAWVLAAVPAPASFGVCFAGASVAAWLSYLALSVVREPPGPEPSPPQPLRRYLARMPGLLRRDPNLAWFLVARGCAVMASMATGFYTVHALRAHGALSWQAGVFTAVMLAGQIVGSLALGWLADRAGHRVVIMIGAAALLLGNLTAWSAPSLVFFLAVFALAGIHQAAVHVSNLNILLEFAPETSERPTYVGLGNTSMAPLAFGSPIAAGLLADVVGLGPLFGLSAAFGAASLSLMAGKVRDPRAVQSRG